MSALGELAAELRGEEVIAPHVRDSDGPTALGRLAAAGPRAAEAQAEYEVLFEAIREGYLVHYGEPRLLDGADEDLLLLAGDFLYALGLMRLAARGDMDAVRELGDLISLAAQLHARDETGTIPPLWLAAATAVGCGTTPELEAAKEAARTGDPAAAGMLAEAAHAAASAEGAGDAIAEASDSIGFRPEYLPERG